MVIPRLAVKIPSKNNYECWWDDHIYIYIYTPYTIPRKFQQTPGAFPAIKMARFSQSHVDESQSTFFAHSCIEVFVAGAVHEPTLSAVERGLGGQHFALPGTCNCFEVA